LALFLLKPIENQYLRNAFCKFIKKAILFTPWKYRLTHCYFLKEAMVVKFEKKYKTH